MASNVVTANANGNSGRVATYSSGRVIQDSGTLLVALVTYAGATTDLTMGTHAVTGSGIIRLVHYHCLVQLTVLRHLQGH